jgi:formimidoylglutamate deiminase
MDTEQTVLLPDRLWTGKEWRTDWCVAIHNGIIIGLFPATRQSEATRLPGRVLVPGLVNAHSHAFQRVFRGHVQWRQGEDDFWTWREAMYGAANGLDPDGVEAVSRLAFLEMAEAGITHVGEFHYLHHQPDGKPYADPDEIANRVVAAARDVGIRITLLRVAYGRHSFGRALADNQRRFGDRDPAAVLAATDRLRARWSSDPAVSVGLAPHSVRAVPREWFVELASFSGPIHAHVSEQPSEVAACLAEHGCSPVAAFASGGLVDSRFVGVHLTHPSRGDIELLRQADATVCVCPSTELDLGDGFLPLEARDLRLCIGSDSQAVIDPLGEARAIELHARGLAGRRNVMAPPGERHGLADRLLSIATAGGAHALGSRGTLEVGQPADFVTFDLRRPAAEGVPVAEALAFVANPEWVDEVWVAGRRIVEGGRHPQRDAIVAAARDLRPP